MFSIVVVAMTLMATSSQAARVGLMNSMYKTNIHVQVYSHVIASIMSQMYAWSSVSLSSHVQTAF